MPRCAVDGKIDLRKANDLSLQILPMQVPFLEVVPITIRRRRSRLVQTVILGMGIGVATILVLVSGWVMTRG